MALLFDEGLGLVVGTNDKPRWNWGFITAIIIGLLFWLLCIGIVRTANAQAPAPQKQQFLVFADTAGIGAIPGVPDVYSTWVYALSSPTSWPSSAVLVAWDCKAGKVKRLAHVVYRMKADSTGVEGPIVEDNGPWVEPVDPRLFKLVCTIGPTHTAPDATPQPAPRGWYAPGRPRSDA